MNEERRGYLGLLEKQKRLEGDRGKCRKGRHG